MSPPCGAKQAQAQGQPRICCCTLGPAHQHLSPWASCPWSPGTQPRFPHRTLTFFLDTPRIPSSYGGSPGPRSRGGSPQKRGYHGHKSNSWDPPFQSWHHQAIRDLRPPRKPQGRAWIQLLLYLVLDFPPDPLQGLLLGFGEGEFCGDGVALSNQGALLFLCQEQWPGSPLQFLWETVRDG